MPETIQLHIDELDCPDEVALLKRAFAGGPGIVDLFFNVVRGTLTVAFDPSSTTVEQIISTVRTTGMSARVEGELSETEQLDGQSEKTALKLTVAAGLATAVGAVLSSWLASTVDQTPWPAMVAYAMAIAAAWWRIAPKAWVSVKLRQPDMNLLMTIAVIGAVGLGEWFEGATVAFLFMLSNWLESWSVGRARRAIESLMELAPTTARIQLDDGSEVEVDASDVAVAARVVVRPGEKFPLDGRVAEGSTSVDQAPITGESTPVSKAVGDDVFAGTVNQNGAVVVEVTKPAGDTVLAGVIRLVEQAQQRRSPSERFVDQFARYYTPAVIVGAVLVFVTPPLLTHASWALWFYRSLILLVIACPCALVISTPVSIVSGLASAARNGVLIKGGEYLEAVGKTTVMALDKTGTLTAGRPVVEQVIPVDGTDEDKLLEIAAAVEQRSEHWIARAIVAHADKKGISAPPCDDYQAVAGKGAVATVGETEYLIGNHRLLEERTVCDGQMHDRMLEHENCHHIVVALSSADAPLGLFLLADAPREDAPAVVADLRECGVSTVVMLTGDNEGTAAAVAEECGGVEFRAELLPADKVSAIEEYKSAGQRVVMVGDGINDAPALAAAHVGIAMGAGGTDASLETADIGLMTDDLRKLPWLIRHSRRTGAIIKQNIVLSLGVKAVFAVLAVVGLANLWTAIVADTGVSLVVTLNGLRLLRSS